MVAIRHIRIKGFRCIESLDWSPAPGINCLVGPGDSGKSSILDAIDLALNPRRPNSLTEVDFRDLDTASPILIEVTIGDLDEQVLAYDRYLPFFRGYEAATQLIHEEPGVGLEHVLTIRVDVGEDLIPRWSLASSRADPDDDPHDISRRHLTLIGAHRLGPYAHSHLGWGQRSVLHRISDERPETEAAIAKARSAARNAFASEVGDVFTEALSCVSSTAKQFAVSLGEDAKALLDMGQLEVGRGAIAIHDEHGIPASRLGTGSSRLLVAGLLHRVAGSRFCLIDEIEHGLEPYRIAQLLHEFGAKAKEGEAHQKQVFITTHSPFVLRELSADQIHVVRRPLGKKDVGHRLLWAGGDEAKQKALRACAEAFLAPRVLVCEGKTEVGLIRGIDLHWQETGIQSLARCGVALADGGGSDAVGRAVAFAELGYESAIFRDDDINLEAHQLESLRKANVAIIQWPECMSTEQILFLMCPEQAISDLIRIAIDTRGFDSVNADIKRASDQKVTLDTLSELPEDTLREVLVKASTLKGKGGYPRNWFKLIEPGEQIGREVVPKHFKGFKEPFRDTLRQLWRWIKRGASVEELQSI